REQANALFTADFHIFQSSESGTNIVRTISYSMPSSLQDHVKYVHPTVLSPSAPSSCDESIVTPGYNAYPQTADLQFFLDTYRPDLVNEIWTVVSVANGTVIQRVPQPQDQEPNLDTQMIVSLGSDYCNLYMQLGARGTSVIWASGDHGVGDCDGQFNQFSLMWPDSCPYVTTVGATHQFGPEVAANLSSGGFANAERLLDTLDDTYSGLYNASGRGVPDVSAQGVNVAIGFNEEIITLNGTSASAPIFAAIIGQLNNELVAAGKGPLGFLNPRMYANPGAFNDITSENRSNPGCGTDGFPAAKGWDPVTGLGTPNYDALRAAAGL
ncbi:peptidase S8/S53 domain-containing protein, partial [Mycena rosella]